MPAGRDGPSVATRVLVLPLLTEQGGRRLAGRHSGPPAERKLAGSPAGLPYGLTMDELNGICAGIRAAGFDVRLMPTEPLPSVSFHPGRQQYRSSPILDRARKRLEEAHDLLAKLLVLTDADIYEPGLSFTGGMAELGGKVAVVSLARLQSGDRAKLILRTVKEAVHELGHVIGLEHCRNSGCVMFQSRSIADSDVKLSTFCPKCRAVAGRAVG
jgi:archaemetzincin